MSAILENFRGGLRRRDRKFKGLLVDLNTGALRHDHVLIQRAQGAELFIGLGRVAGHALDFAFGHETDDDPFLAACDAIDGALDGGDFAKAQQLGISDNLIGIGEPHLRRLALLEAMIEKAEAEDSNHPRWPAGAPDSVGGRFRPKDSAGEGASLPAISTAKELVEREARRLATRSSIRTAIGGVLRFIAMGVAEFIPFGDIIDLAMIPDLINTISEFEQTTTQANVAVDFVKNGPYQLEDLQSGDGSESFSSFDAFKKISFFITILAKRFGPAGLGQEYHHIVTQGSANGRNIPAEQLQSTDNIVKLPKLVHELVNDEYAKPSEQNSAMTVYDWLQTQPYEVQRAEGIAILQRLGIVKP